MDEQRARVGAIIGAVLHEAVRAAGCDGIVILDDGSPEAHLLAEWTRSALGETRVWSAIRNGKDGYDAEENLRYQARVMARERNALTAHPANKTALLLGRSIPPEPLLPLGDLYATEIEALAGAWSAPPDVHALVGRILEYRQGDRGTDVEPASGIYDADWALRALFERWVPPEQALAGLPEPCRGPFLEAVRRGRFWRERAGLIPKLSSRTIGIDLFA